MAINETEGLGDKPFLRVKMYSFLNSLKEEKKSFIRDASVSPDNGMLSNLVAKGLTRGNGLKFNLGKLALTLDAFS